MMKQVSAAIAVILSTLAWTGHVHAQQNVFAELGGVQLLAENIELPDYPRFVATKVIARGIDSESKLVTFANISITGSPVQTHSSWFPVSFVPSGNALGRPVGGPLYAGEWADLDTHLLISGDMIAGGTYEFIEANDHSFGMGPFPLWLVDAESVVGIGELTMTNPTDAFSVLPEFQQNEIELAYVVTRAELAASNPVQMTAGFVGSGITDAGVPGGAAFGYDGSSVVNVPFIPEPSSGLMVAIAGVGLLGMAWRNAKQATK